MNPSRLLKKFAIAAVCAAGLVSSMAMATPIAVDTVYVFSGFTAFASKKLPAPAGGAPYATVTLKQTSDKEVDVDVALATGYYFANTGNVSNFNSNGPTFAFNLLSAYTGASIGLIGSSSTNFNIGTNASYGSHTSTYTNGLILKSSGGSGQVSALDFSVTLDSGIPLTAFADANGIYAFNIDIGISGKTGTAKFGGTPTEEDIPPPPTGTGDGHPHTVPEPASLALMGLGLLGVGALRKRNKV